MEAQLGIQDYTQKGKGLYSECQVIASAISQPKKQNTSTCKSRSSASPTAVKKKPLRSPEVLEMKNEDDTKPMSSVEKRQLSIDIQLLPSDKLARVVHIFLSLEQVDGPVPEEVVMDIDKLKPSTLRVLQSYIDSIPTTKFYKTYERKQMAKEENKRGLADTLLDIPKADLTNEAHSVVTKQVADAEIGIASTASTQSNLKADDDFGIVVEFNLLPSSDVTMAVLEIVKIEVSVGGTGISENPTQRRNSSKKPPKMGFELERVVSEITSEEWSESPPKLQNKRLKLNASQ